MKCRHKTKRRPIRIAHPEPDKEWVAEVCEECGAERIAEVERDERGMLLGHVSALPWRTAPEETKLRLVK